MSDMPKTSKHVPYSQYGAGIDQQIAQALDIKRRISTRAGILLVAMISAAITAARLIYQSYPDPLAGISIGVIGPFIAVVCMTFALKLWLQKKQSVFAPNATWMATAAAALFVGYFIYQSFA